MVPSVVCFLVTHAVYQRAADPDWIWPVVASIVWIMASAGLYGAGFGRRR